jgi:hypothetical protein
MTEVRRRRVGQGARGRQSAKKLGLGAKPKVATGRLKWKKRC